MNSRDTPGTVVILDERGGENKTLSLKQLETYQGERQLRIIMPLDGNFKQKKIVCWKQSQQLGQKCIRRHNIPSPEQV